MPFSLPGSQTYHCTVCRDYGVIAVDADSVVACRSCDPQERIVLNRAVLKARIEAGIRYWQLLQGSRARWSPLT